MARSQRSMYHEPRQNLSLNTAELQSKHTMFSQLNSNMSSLVDAIGSQVLDGGKSFEGVTILHHPESQHSSKAGTSQKKMQTGGSSAGGPIQVSKPVMLLAEQFQALDNIDVKNVTVGANPAPIAVSHHRATLGTAKSENLMTQVEKPLNYYSKFGQMRAMQAQFHE